MPLPSARTPVKAIIFDIGRVIVRLNLNRSLDLLALSSNDAESHSRRSADEIWKLLQSDERWLDWQEGRITPEEWYRHLLQLLHIKLSFDEFCAAWNAVLDPDLILPECLFAELSSRFRLGLLSNTDAIHVACLEAEFSFLRYFPVRIYSNQVGASKPSPKIFQAALYALGVDAREALYIDDIAEYAQAARALGMDAIHFENADRLLCELSRRSLLANEGISK